MAYTEIQKRNGEKYYYRVLSVRLGKKVSKKRIYLGKIRITANIRFIIGFGKTC
jgi:hypothetical protein